MHSEIEFAAVPARVVEAHAHRVEIRNHRLIAQIDALECHGEIVVDLVTCGRVPAQVAGDQAQVVVVARIDAARIQILAAEVGRDARLEDAVVIVQRRVEAGTR